MPQLIELLANRFSPELTVWFSPARSRRIQSVAFIEQVSGAEHLRESSAVVLSCDVSIAVSAGHVFDVLLRRAAESGVAALIMRGIAPRSLTAEHIANKAGITLLSLDEGVEIGGFLIEATHFISGSASDAISRISKAARALDDTELESDQIVETFSRATELTLTYEAGGTSRYAPVEVEGRQWGAISSVEEGDAAEIATRVLASLVSRLLTKKERDALSPARSVSAILAELILAPSSRVDSIAQRAIEFGVMIDGWHSVARISLGGTNGAVGVDPVALYELEEEVLRRAVRLGRSTTGLWTATRSGASLVVVRTTRTDPGRKGVTEMCESMSALLEQISSRYPSIHLLCGVGTIYSGAAGLRVSEAESRTALASAISDGRAGTVSAFDSLGVRRMLAEWLVTDTARETVRDLLAPLDALGAERAHTAIHTLHVYLDERGSLKRTAERLHLHRNAVVYRMTQINELLGQDLNDPDRRFAFQLACRARLLATTDM